METSESSVFQSFSRKVGTFDVREKVFLIPQMNRTGCLLMAAAFRAFGAKAQVMETYQGLELGKEFTSGKECFPCQVTTGDILHFMAREKERLSEDFDARDYVYFMPEAGGPCRFGMYNKFQRIVLDSFPHLQDLKIGSLTSDNAYSPVGMIREDQVVDFRKTAYLSVVVADILDRLLWRIRPYEKEPGAADAFMERAIETLSRSFERHGQGKGFSSILDDLERTAQEGAALINPDMPRKPLIGIVGEIYLRTHTQANQDIIRMLERYGAEVVNASIAEWINYTAYDCMRRARIDLRRNLRLLRYKEIRDCLSKIAGYGLELFYRQLKMKQGYKRIRHIIDLPGDHNVGQLERVLLEEDLFSFDVGTEACLSIAGVIGYMREGYNGVVNVYPFTCMPSTITSAVVRPVANRHRLPYLDTPCDGTFQPGREAAVRTFMYQAHQHMKRNGRK